MVESGWSRSERMVTQEALVEIRVEIKVVKECETHSQNPRFLG